MTWPTKRQKQKQWQIYFENTSKERSVWLLTIEAFDQSDENTFKEWFLGLLTIETFDQSGEETWPDQQKDKDKDNDKYILRTPPKRSLWLLTIEAFDQSDEETWPDQKKDNNKDKHNDNDKSSESDH